MKDLLEHLTQTRRYETHIANLAQRLDYNDYYKEAFAGGLQGDLLIREKQ